MERWMYTHEFNELKIIFKSRIKEIKSFDWDEERHSSRRTYQKQRVSSYIRQRVDHPRLDPLNRFETPNTHRSLGIIVFREV